MRFQPAGTENILTTKTDRFPPSPRPDIRDPVCGMRVQPETTAGGRTHYQGTDYYFCSSECAEKFRDHPDRYPAARPSVPVQETAPAPPIKKRSRWLGG